MITVRRVAWRSLAAHWRVGLAVIFGICVATGVITGSLVIGDTVRASLARTVVDRLGTITHALTAPKYLRTAIADELPNCAALIMQDATVRHDETDAVVPGAVVVGVDERFLSYFPTAGPDAMQLSGREVAVNAALAADLGISAGDFLLVTANRRGPTATSNIFARRALEETTVTMRVEVTAVLPSPGPGDFRLDAAALPSRNIFISREWFAERLDRAGQANTLVVQAPADMPPGDPAALARQLAAHVNPEDYGLEIRPVSERGYVATDSLATVLTERQVADITRAAYDLGARVEPVSVFIATTIAPADASPASTQEIAYAVLAGRQSLSDDIAEDELWLNEWAARDIGAEVGRWYEVTYLVATAGGDYINRTVKLRLARILPLADHPPDPGLVPNFEGITDAVDIAAWNPPFPVDLNRVTDRDDEYWDLYRAAPRGFVHPNTARHTWTAEPFQSADEWVTSVLLHPADGHSPAALAAALSSSVGEWMPFEHTGLGFVPVRRNALEAARGTSDFTQLFLGLSMFLVLSGAALAAMLLRLTVMRRAAEAGIMLAVGCTSATVSRVLLWEGMLLTCAGALAGTALGIGYARLMVHGLATWWSGALGGVPGLWFELKPLSVALGAAAGLAVGALSALWSLRVLKGTRVLELLAGWRAAGMYNEFPSARRAVLLTCILTAGALVFALLGLYHPALAAESAFFGVGALLLAALIAFSDILLKSVAGKRASAMSLPLLAVRNAAANRSRSLLAIGLLGCAVFAIVAVAANTRDFGRYAVTDRDSGTGGFVLRMDSSFALPYDPADAQGRARLGFTPDDEKLFDGVEIIGLYASPGDDISCLNIARPARPRLLGITEAMSKRGGFGVNDTKDQSGSSPWESLRTDSSDGTIAAIADEASIRWTLHTSPQKGYLLTTGDGREIPLDFVGTVSGSILQGEILVGEQAFRQLFPGEQMPRVFFIDAPPQQADDLAAAIRRVLGELGVEVRHTREILAAYARVQNTYIAVFLTLGALGLLLGTVGMATVVMRGVLERRAELALMEALGFSRTRIVWLLFAENALLLAAGLTVGTITALVAVAPVVGAGMASVPWGALTAALVAILCAGLVALALAARISLRGISPAVLREE